MTPLIKSGQKHVLSPITLDEVEVGDIVFCKVKGRYYTHLVKAKGDRGVLIGNNRGKINGWTKSVFGKVTKRLKQSLAYGIRCAPKYKEWGGCSIPL